ncbi:ubiquinol-cytochrome C chaperone family protein [Phenylobacterium sp.]|jgi:cytochrome b pre-mRNA-processing protein 3|uniref:ubiquinol-cytochrome C chaperone family protein n=1 Tax=Phenylobacterium sp. TaxID=1871053 RepID=UPI002F928F13
MLQRLFRPRPARDKGRALYASAVAQSRAPALYGEYGVPDTVEGRFEAYSLHVILLLDRLQGEGPVAAETSQAVFDTFVKSLDDALREMGVGDLSVGKKMRRLGEAFFGRVKNYQAAFASLPDHGDLEAVIARTVYADGDAAHAPALARYAVRQREALAAQPIERLLAADVAWSAP